MGDKQARSARGEIVDFGELMIKAQIAATPTIEIKPQENFLDKRMKRQIKKAASVQAAETAEADTSTNAEQQ